MAVPGFIVGLSPLGESPLAGEIPPPVLSGEIEVAVAGAITYTPSAAVEVTEYISPGTIEDSGGSIVYTPPAAVEVTEYISPGTIEAHETLYGQVFTAPFPIERSYWTLHYAPASMWPGYSSDGTNITIPIADLPGLSAAEADTVTGDWREVLQSILLSLSNYMDWSKENPITAHSRPQTISAFLLEDWNQPVVNQMRRDFQIKFVINHALQKLREEST